MHEQVKKLLELIYSDEKIADIIHLDGGAALSFFYDIERNFSLDLDFTIETDEALEYTQKNLSASEIKPLSVDLVTVPSEYCRYESRQLGSVNISLHTIADILAEKFCCLIDRDTYRDLWDTHQIIEKHRPNITEVATLFEKKQELKNSSYNTLKDFLNGLDELVRNKNNWSGLEPSMIALKDYLKTQPVLRAELSEYA